MNRPTRRINVLLAVIAVLVLARAGLAQEVPWNIYVDTESNSVCDLVNAANVELVVLSDNGPLAIITGPDVILTQTFVDDDSFVFFDGDSAGFIDFAEDGDGFRTLWWITFSGTAAYVDPFTGEPSDSGLFPDEFVGVPCDACLLWDDPFVCGGTVVDSDLDGIEDPFDFCPETPFGQPVDVFGCACSELDSDLDGVVDCDDVCPNTPLLSDVDDDGCACLAIDSDFDGVDDCDDDCPGTPFGALVNFVGCACSQIPACDCLQDHDLDGVGDCDDFCPDTPLGAITDLDGCACFEIDSDGDDVDDCDDECPGTPFDEPADAHGCACSQVLECACRLDQDGDGVNDCDDDCPNTPLGTDVGADGCPPDLIINPGPVFITCGSLNSMTLGMGLLSLCGMRLLTRRRWRSGTLPD